MIRILCLLEEDMRLFFEHSISIALNGLENINIRTGGKFAEVKELQEEYSTYGGG